MAFNHGRLAYFSYHGSNLSAYVSKVDMPQAVQTNETTTLGATARSYIAGLKDTTFSVDFIWDPALDAILQPDLGGAQQAFIFGPAGSTTGLVRKTGNTILKDYKVNAPVADVVKATATFQNSGAIVSDTFP